MTTLPSPGARSSRPKRSTGNFWPMAIVAFLVLALYWPLMLWVNAGQAQRIMATGADLGCGTATQCATQLRNPTLPAPGQLLSGFRALSVPPFSTTSAPSNALVTAGETIVGLAIASVLGIVLALLLVISRGFERAVLPWLIASQMVPIIALAPMLAVVLGQYGVQGWVPKAIIAAYIAFFPVAIGVARGLRSPDPLQLDLLRTYHAGHATVFWKLQLPASIPFLFTALKVAATAALIGSIVAEISTISFSGLGKMLAENSRASDTIALWVIMIYGAALGIFLVGLVGLIERAVTPWRVGQPK
ncbi:ABC transporter permease [Deinococcus yavapaiensis]|uniref:NitT/TauT family transport system permease protein n=1 Tax=Deinococcus yavapaiensis KR-236 TaxID=694435 RepID=A0A318SAU1_9DEIO|nr:ABC transporter permease [Deinococcus yavapaiensis]PYE55979.1 NitT/TauT family transport system permease protein [Deinococcus yavapaiensis KR-236]